MDRHCQNQVRLSLNPSAHSLFRFIVVASFLLLLPALSFAQAKRVVIIKIDGLPYGLVDQCVRERDARTGKSQLPWIEHIFYQRGARLANFYVRGMSLSAPSWSLLDTGQHLQIKGNVEFDRYTLHSYDYLNFMPFYFKSVSGARVDMPGVEVLDSLGLPLVFDAFSHQHRYPGFQLYQRGMRFSTLQDGLHKRFVKNPRELWDEWTLGFETRSTFFDQMERELHEKLTDPGIRYLDLFIGDFDHVAHHNRDHPSHLAALQKVDRLLGRVWASIQKSPLAADTALIVVSDHGFNTDERVYSQGYNLVKLLGSAGGGGHHVITKRRLLLDYSLKGMNFMVPLITTTTSDSYYLRGQSSDYPTALVDFDGNERASIHLRDSDLNLLHILLVQLQRNDQSPAVRPALVELFFKTLGTRRSLWQNTLDELVEELVVLRRRIQEQRKLWEAQPKKFSPEELRLGRDDQKTRIFAQLERWVSQEKDYTEYARTLSNLLALRKENAGFPSEPPTAQRRERGDGQPGSGDNLAKLKIEDVIAKHAMGERNSIYHLQNYIVGLAPGGFVLKPDRSVDLEKSFQRIDYLALLQSLTVRNNVQREVANKPVDIVATRIPSDLVQPLLHERLLTPDVVWVYGGPEKQALILAREDEQGRLSLRYQPIKNLTQNAEGRVHFEHAPWEPGLPLRILEDDRLAVPQQNRESWLSEWHTDAEWLRALHLTNYSNGLIGLYEGLAQHRIERLALDEPAISADERVARRFLKRQRELIETDLLLVANDHWNFDVRGFNPGGNHGSFFRISTHSVFMVAGGEQTQVPRGIVIEEPYDSLSFAPTILALTGNLRDDNVTAPVLWDKGFRRFPGRIVREILPGGRVNGKTAIDAAGAAP